MQGKWLKCTETMSHLCHGLACMRSVHDKCKALLWLTASVGQEICCNISCDSQSPENDASFMGYVTNHAEGKFIIFIPVIA